MLMPLLSGRPAVQNEEGVGTIHEQTHFEADMPDYGSSGYIDRLKLDGYESENPPVTSFEVDMSGSSFDLRHMLERTTTDQEFEVEMLDGDSAIESNFRGVFPGHGRAIDPFTQFSESLHRYGSSLKALEQISKWVQTQ
jgi:hypothetical protein